VARNSGLGASCSPKVVSTTGLLNTSTMHLYTSLHAA